MIRSVKVTGFRALRRFSMQNLGRINLLVGKNNAGKSSVLEALYLLSNAGAPTAIWTVLMRRGENIVDTPVSGRAIQQEIDLRHLFHGHVLQIGTAIEISTSNGNPNRSIRFEIGEAKPEGNLALFAQASQVDLGVPQLSLSMLITGDPAPPALVVPLSGRGGLRQDVLQTLINLTANKPPPQGGGNLPGTTQYVTTEALAISEVQAAFNEISLSPREERVIRALNFIEPDIERIATAQGPFFSGPGWPTRGGLKAKLRNLEEPVPIGSMGEGIWRMLSLAISLSRAKDGIFLIDEIDTGLHFSVMAKLWRFVAETAREFNVQVFATTHSLDCVRSLALVCSEDPEIASDATIQRIQNDSRAISYNESEILALAKASTAHDEIEVR
jgi:ABC-type branched-subunit amino acid transport system ATPase component